MEKEIQGLFIKKGLTLSTAESCTGGRIAARLTAIPGSSAYYLGSIIAYSNALKIKALGVSKQTLERYGAVSEEVVKEMAAGAIELTGSDYSLAVTGIAGPEGGTAEKPVGTVWCAIGKKGRAPEAWLLRASGTRQEIMDASVEELLQRLLEV